MSCWGQAPKECLVFLGGEGREGGGRVGLGMFNLDVSCDLTAHRLYKSEIGVKCLGSRSS